MHADVAIIGGSFAGLSAALQLARARRTVTVLDTGRPRNRFAAASHGFLTQDGARPSDILAIARRQLLTYPTARIVDGSAEGASGASDAFAIRMAGGDTLDARRLVLAHGVVDTLPDVPGLDALWGTRVAHCPYCHGYEFGGGALGVLAAGPAAMHQAMLVREWGPLTLFVNGVFEPDADEVGQLTARGVTIEREAVLAVEPTRDGLVVRLAGDRAIPLAGLFTQPRSALASGIAQDLGCALADGVFGPIVSVRDFGQTSVAGVFAAGDMARPAPSVALAVADGAMAGLGAHRSLVFV